MGGGGGGNKTLKQAVFTKYAGSINFKCLTDLKPDYDLRLASAYHKIPQVIRNCVIIIKCPTEPFP